MHLPYTPNPLCAVVQQSEIGMYRERRNFRWGLIFVSTHPHENLYTRKIGNSNYGRLLSPKKIIP